MCAADCLQVTRLPAPCFVFIMCKGVSGEYLSEELVVEAWLKVKIHVRLGIRGRMVPARSRQVVSCGRDRGLLAAGAAGRVAGQAAGAMAPSEKTVAGVAAGRPLAAAGWTPRGTPLLRCGVQLSCGINGTSGAGRVNATAE